MSSSRRSANVSEFLSPFGEPRETARPAAPVCQTLRSQTQSNPIRTNRSSSASGTSSSVAGRPSDRAQLREPDARVDLVKRWITTTLHGCTSAMTAAFGSWPPQHQ